MTDQQCSETRELLPEKVRGDLDPALRARVEHHLRQCAACREEMELLEALLDARPEPPEQLGQDIQARLRRELPSLTRTPEHPRQVRAGSGSAFLRRSIRPGPSWALAAAAVLVLALGLGIFWRPGSTGTEQGEVQVAVQDPPPEAWLWDDGIVAGAPVFDELSDEELEALIEEFGG